MSLSNPIRALALALALAAPVVPRASAPGEPLTAVRRQGALAIDGRLEEADWARAVPFDGFVQVFPREGAAPSERTEVRVLFDDRVLYVGVRCEDHRPDEIHRPLGRRDSNPYGDGVTVVIDSMRDGRNGFVFILSAAGVQSDGLQSDDDDYSGDWDAVWDGATAATADGWSAELAIPLAALRFRDRPEQVFGFAVKRTLARTHEDLLTALVPRSARGQIARINALVGLDGLRPVRDVAFAPYVAARVAVRPQYDDATRPSPRLVDPVGDFGFDAKASLGRGLALQGTVNPDFGQVEADQLIQNLTSFEQFFPEKRPFFTEGMDLFQPVAPQGRRSPQQLFYSRRVGLDAPILGAAKLTGSAGDALQIGAVEAFVSGAGSNRPPEAPDRSVAIDPAQPLWLGPRSALPRLAPAAENYLAAVARWRPDPTRSFGATVTSAVLAGPACTEAEAALDDDHRPRRCDALAGNAAAADYSLRTRDGEWFARGQLTGSQALGGAPLRVLADGTALRPGDLGWGGYASAGRSGGEPWRFEVQWEYESPRLELNAAGFQRTQNEQVARAILRHVRPRGWGPFLSTAAQLGAEARWTTDGRGLDRGRQVWGVLQAQLPSFWWVGTAAVLDLARWDVREMDQTGIALEQPADLVVEGWIQTDPSRPLYLEVDVNALRTASTGPLPGVTALSVLGKVVLRPHPRLESRLELQYDRSHWPARYVLDDGAGTDLFADLAAPALSVTVREQVVLTPRLTLQAYAQLFTTYARYRGFFEARPRDGRIRIADLRPATRPLDAYAGWENPDYRDGALNVNVVLRWEYRLGSTFYLVYTRAQRELGWPDAPLDPSPPATLRPHALAAGPATDTVLVKWSYWWSR